MFGSKACLGVIMVSANTILEPDLYRIAPPGVSLHFSRARMVGDVPACYERMLEDVPRCTEELMDADVDAIAFVCTAVSMYRGAGADAELCAQIEKQSGKPATATSLAVVEALRELNVHRLAVGTPYETWTNDREVEYLEGSGFEVVAVEGLGCDNARVMTTASPQTAFDLASRIDRPDADGIFLSCTNFRSVEALERIEAATGKPAVCSNQATLWKLLRMTNVSDPVSGAGKLLTLPRVAEPAGAP